MLDFEILQVLSMVKESTEFKMALGSFPSLSDEGRKASILILNSVDTGYQLFFLRYSFH